MSRRYLLIAPCRDEEQYMRRTLDSLASQTLAPALCVVVDDGSTDATPRILSEYAEKLPWLRIVTRANRGRRAVGPGVIEAFYAGLDTVDLEEFDYLCKLDLDLDLHERYFETLVEHMEAEPRLGTFSGKPYVSIDGELIPEPAGDEMSVGMTKFFRTACFQQVGGFVREVMWDGIDCHRARMLGWLAGSADNPAPLRFEHLRPMGSSQLGIHTGRQRHGFGQWFMGTGPLYMLASSLFRMRHPPYISGGLSMFWGYLKAAWNDAPRYGDLRFRRFLRRYQWLMLTRGKATATAQLCREQAWAFDPERAPPGMGQYPMLPFPVRDDIFPRTITAGLGLDAPTPDAFVDHVLSTLQNGRGGWAQAFDATSLERYRTDHAFAQLVQSVDLALAPAVGIHSVIRILAERPDCGVAVLTHDGKPPEAAPAGSIIRLPEIEFDDRASVAEKAISEVARSGANIIVLELPSPAQEWLAEQLRRHVSQAWILVPRSAPGPSG